MAALTPTLPACGSPGDLPDYLGFARALIGDELCQMMARKEVTGFDVMFRAYFQATLAVHDAQVAEHSAQTDIRHLKLASDTLLDLADLSGLALLFSELHGTDFVTLVIAQWDAFFANVPEPQCIIKVLFTALDEFSWPPMFTAGANMRMEWQKVFLEAADHEGLVTEEDVHCWPRRGQRSKHASPIIRSIHFDLEGVFLHPYCYFGAIYLAGRPEAAGVTFPPNVVNCQKNIQRETNASDSKGESDEQT